MSLLQMSIRPQARPQFHLQRMWGHGTGRWGMVPVRPWWRLCISFHTFARLCTVRVLESCWSYRARSSLRIIFEQRHCVRGCPRLAYVSHRWRKFLCPAACPCLARNARWRGTRSWQERRCLFASTTGAFTPPGNVAKCLVSCLSHVFPANVS